MPTVENQCGRSAAWKHHSATEATSICIPPSSLEEKPSFNYDPRPAEQSEDELLLDEEEFEQDMNRTLARLSPFRRNFYEFFELQTSFWAKLFAFCVSISIVASIAMVLAESVYEYQTRFMKQYPHFRFTADLICMNIFTFELIGKFLGTLNRWRFFTNIFNLIDLICLIPYYVELFVPVPFFSNPFIRIMRLLRVLRLLRGFNPSRGSMSIRITARTIRHSMPQIALVVGYLIIFMVISASFLFVAELEQMDLKTGKIMRTGPDGILTESPFQSIPSTFYWALTTLTTTGYGDQTPVSFWGKFIANMTMVCGVMVFALPATIIGSIYSRVKFQARLRKNQKMIEKLAVEESRVKNTQRHQLLREQHETILFAIEEFQERLCEVNPPFYYRKYKEMKELYEQTLDRLSALESDYNHLLKEFTQLRRPKKSSGGTSQSIMNFRKYGGIMKTLQEDSMLSPTLRDQSRDGSIAELNPAPPPPHYLDLLQPRTSRLHSIIRRRSSSQSSTRRAKRKYSSNDAGTEERETNKPH